MSQVPDMMQSTGYLLYKAGMLAQRGLDEALAAAELTYREFLVLAFTASDELSQQDVSRRLSIDPTLIVAAVDALEERGLVERTRDPRDRRRYVLVVTGAGKAALGTAAKAARRVDEQFLAGLGDAKAGELNKLLREALAPHLPWLR
jgi:DNA-binding MarR family transcriptional regulator